MPRVGVIAIGLDSADLRLVSRWCDAGELPVLAALRDRGAAGVLATPPGLGDDPVWASFATALSPGRHGRYHHHQARPGSYAVRPFREAHGELFWDVLGQTGRRVAVLDVPKCRLSRGPHGLQVSDWLVHGRDGATASFPREIAAKLLTTYGDDMNDRAPEYLCTMEALPAARQPEFLERLLDSVERKTAAALDLLGRDAWDLFLVVFKEAHCVGHQFWHFANAAHDPAAGNGPAGTENPLLLVYRALDRAIGRLLATVDDSTDVVVFSDLGMANNITGEHLLDAVLLRLEDSRIPRAWERIRQATCRAPRLVRRAAAAVDRHVHRLRTAYQLEHNELSGAVRINLEGRERNGRVRAGAEFEAVIRRLTTDLLALVHPGSRAPLVDRVLRTDEVFPGEHRDLLPDLFVLWNRDRPIHGASSPKVGLLRLPGPPWRTGNHASDGFYFAAGPSIVAGHQAHGSIMDLGPTLGHLLGVSFPLADGRPLPGFNRRP